MDNYALNEEWELIIEWIVNACFGKKKKET